MERTDSLGCGRATAGMAEDPTRGGRIRLHFCPKGRNRGFVPSSRREQGSTGALHLGSSNPSSPKAEKRHTERCVFFLVGEDGFEPSKRNAADLQSVPFGHSGTPPYLIFCFLNGAGRRTRTPDLLITNQLLYRLSYTGGSNRTRNIIT